MLFTSRLKKRHSYNLLAGLLFCISVSAQIPGPPKTVQSPNAAGLGNYGDFVVSPFTGVPDISVSLHTVSDGNIEVPISLNYDASGVRPDVHPGWVGQNFRLSVNFAVIRTVKDAPDDSPNALNSLWQRGYVNGDVRNLLNYGAADWASASKLETIAYNSGTFDTEPDEYNFSAPGLSGKFYLSHDGQWRVQSDRPVKVELLSTSEAFPPFTPPYWTGNPWGTGGASSHYMPHFSGFIVTDDQGTKYQYGGDNSFSEYSIDFFNQGKGTWLCNSWHLNSITSQTGQVTSFIYERGDFVAQMFFSVYNKSSRVYGGSWFSCENWSSLIGAYGAFDGKLISPVYLKQIASDNFKVNFISTESTELRYTEDIFTTYCDKKIASGAKKLDFLSFLYDCFYPVNNAPSGCDNNTTLSMLLGKLKWRKLDKIQIQDGSGTTIKEFELTYNNVLTERLMLKKVQEKSVTGVNTIPPYEFSYFTDPSLTLPGYAKSHTDHWGFNNGKNINVSDFDAMAGYGSAYRSAATDKRYYQLFSLVQIKYPTGGVTKFWHEPHTYAKEVKLKRWEGVDLLASNQTAGGLRIKEIHSYDPNIGGAIVKKKYYYLSVFNPALPDTSVSVLSSGVLGGKTEYYWPNYRPKPSEAGITIEEEIFSTQSLLPGTENSLGSHVGYSNVVEWTSTEGWTVHKFSNFDNGYQDAAPVNYIQESATAYEPCNSNTFQRGKLLEKVIYHQNGNPLARTTLQYSLVGATDNSVRSVKAGLRGLCNTDNRVYEGTAYLISVAKFLPSEEMSYSYNSDDPSKYNWTAKNYAYIPNGQLLQVGSTDSKTIGKVPAVIGGQTLQAYDRQIQTSYTYPASYTDGISTAMAAKNIIGIPVETLTRLATISGGQQVFSPLKWEKTTFGLFNGNLYLPQKVELKLGAAATAVTESEFISYDARGNLLGYKGRDGVSTKLEYFTVADVGKVDLLKKKTTGDGTAEAQITSYTYKPSVGLETLTDPANKVLYYEYDDFNRLKNVRYDGPTGPVRTSYSYRYRGN